MVARKLSRDVLLDLYLLYKDKSNDFTLEYLANKVGISRSRLGKLFKRINPDSLEVNYDNYDEYLDSFDKYLNGVDTVSNLAKNHGVTRATIYRKFDRLTNGE